MTFIDRKSKRLVTVSALSQTQDSSGDYGTGTYTATHTGIVADIQSINGGLAVTPSGQTVNATHRMFTEQYFSDIVINNKVVDGSKNYLVVFAVDWREHFEYLLREL